MTPRRATVTAKRPAPKALTDSTTDRRRVCVERVTPEIDGGRFPIKRVVGEEVVVEADVFMEGHDAVSCALRFLHEGEATWHETRMTPLGGDRWRAAFTTTELGHYRYTVEGWVDPLQTWYRDLETRIAHGSHTPADFQIGAALIEQAAARAPAPHARRLTEWAERVTGVVDRGLPVDTALDAADAALARDYPDRSGGTRHPRELRALVERPRARTGAWYEMFPRSCTPDPSRHGSFRDCLGRLDYVASMGFDVLYLPPIHPIGVTHRKGKNNTTMAEPGDVGSPWAIGGEAGGHTAIHPELGTLDDFEALVAAAGDRGMEIALDIAFQCTPDHPWVEAHPTWFKHRPDGTIQYAENPPKKYQDIYPIDFETTDWAALWQALRGVFVYWAQHGVRIFRVDNPHTKPFRFWEWVIAQVRQDYNDAVFLSEAFTRPRVMYHLAKAGFSQSYTYFTWRNSKKELVDYFTELTRTEVCEYFRPNLWPNTPDILSEYLQHGGRPAFITRLVLAATLGASYGIYGPAYELCEAEPREPGSEEYRHSEKYEIRPRDLETPWSLRPLVTRLNRARRDNTALQTDRELRFHPVDNDLLLCYSKTTADRSQAVVIVANLDCTHTQSGWVTLDLERVGLTPDETYQMHDLISDARYGWHGARNFIQLNPHEMPAHVFRVRRKSRTERDFDYFL